MRNLATKGMRTSAINIEDVVSDSVLPALSERKDLWRCHVVIIIELCCRGLAVYYCRCKLQRDGFKQSRMRSPQDG